MNVYRFADYDDARLFTHERKMDQAELRALLLEHVAPLAEAEEVLLTEGEARFGKGCRFHYTENGKVYRWRADDCLEAVEIEGADAATYEEWETRYLAAASDTIGDVARAAGFTELEPVGVHFPAARPLEAREALERNR